MTEILSLLALGALKVLVLLAAAAVLSRILRRRPARIRAVLWAAALAGALLIPVATPLLPNVKLPLPTVFDTTRLPASRDDRPLASTAGTPAKVLTTAQPMGSQARTGAVSRRAPLTWTSGLLALWLLGTTVLLMHLALGLLRVRRILKVAVRLDDRRWNSLLENAAHSVGRPRPIRLLISPDVEIPATVGLFRPTVLIPTYGRDWPEGRRLAVLLHELVHVRRLDWAVRMFARLARAVYWFIPLTWWAVRRLDLEQELACDEEVVALGTRPTAYADHLLAIARSASLNPATAIPGMAMARTPDLERRIMTILKNTSHRRVGIAVLIPAVILVAAMVSALAAMTPSGTGELDGSPPEAATPANPEIEKIVAEMKATEEELERHMEEVQAKGSAIQRQVEAVEPIEVDEEAVARVIARIEEAMEPHLERIKEIEINMEPFEAEMAQLEAKLHDFVLHVEDGTLDEIHRQINEQLRENLEMVEFSHQALEPHLKQLELVHLEMEELHKHLEKIHEGMEPRHEAIEKMHRELKPLHEEMSRMRHKMAPFHHRMEQLGDQLDDAIVDEISGTLRSRMGAVTGPGAPFGEAARRIVDGARVRVHNDVIAVESPFSESREVLQDLFKSHRNGAEDAFDDAVTAAAKDLENLRIPVQ